MEFSASYSNLFDGLSKVVGAALKNSPVEYLSDIKLVAEGEKLHMLTTNMDISISTICDVKVKKFGTICLDAFTFFDIIKKLKSDEAISCALTGSHFVIKSGKSKFTLATHTAEKYPESPSEQPASSFNVSSGEFVKLIEKTRACIYPNETRYNINGLLLHISESEPSKMTLVATDGHRLATAFCKLTSEVAPVRVILPKKATLELHKILSSIKECDINIEFMGKRMRFSFGNVVFTTKLVDAEFPAYEKVVPQSNDKILTINAKKLITVVDRVSSISSSPSEIGIKLDISNKILSISATKNDANTAEDELECTFSSDEKITMTCNFNYLREILTCIESENASINIKDSTVPLIITDASMDFFSYVLMPMRI